AATVPVVSPLHDPAGGDREGEKLVTSVHAIISVAHLIIIYFTMLNYNILHPISAIFDYIQTPYTRRKSFKVIGLLRAKAGLVNSTIRKSRNRVRMALRLCNCGIKQTGANDGNRTYIKKFG
ncbi:hypothetical protein, partial [Gluconobacter sp. Dm-44]|uniref:hypothetical protein n=1 Tax=Gluconobacter sp. Dm-44 TaxID=2799805 RepID=UPI001B8ADD73